MIYFDAVFFDGETSALKKVSCEMDSGFLIIRENHESILCRVLLSECVIESALGKTRDVIILPGGARCETCDKRVLKGIRQKRGNLWDIVHAFESLWPLVIAGIAITVAAVCAFAVYGIPVAGDLIAPAVPVSVLESLSDRTLESLDSNFLQKSDLSAEKQKELVDLFQKHSRNIDSSLDYRLLFRKSDILGANAFALPSGDIVITDALAALYKTDLEIAGVFAHEIAHAYLRHGVKSIIQNAGVFILLSLLLGDFTAMSSTVAVLPVVLAESGYSRIFEKEADLFAGEYLVKTSGNCKPYIRILERLSEKSDFPEMPLYLSTHPPVKDRIILLDSLNTGRN